LIRIVFLAAFLSDDLCGPLPSTASGTGYFPPSDSVRLFWLGRYLPLRGSIALPMKLPLLKTTGPILAALVFTSALAGAATVIDHLPYDITASGVYELQSDLTANGTDGINVRANNVVINLNGFTLTGSESAGVEVDSDNVIVRDGSISSSAIGVWLKGSQCKVEDLRLLKNAAEGILVQGGKNNSVVNCFIIETGEVGPLGIGIKIQSDSGNLVKGNQITECETGISSSSNGGNAIIHNYVANSTSGLILGDHDCYQGNVVTNCTTAFFGGHAVGVENGSD
jgi:Periplasmic copper-binding protein (NosD)